MELDHLLKPMKIVLRFGASVLMLTLLPDLACCADPASDRHEEDASGREITAESQQTIDRGLAWLQRNQGSEGNWTSDELGLVSMGALAFLAAGHKPGSGPYGQAIQRALDCVLAAGEKHERGLLNVAASYHDMYNHGLSTFVLGQAYGVAKEARIKQSLDRALRLIAETQCDDGGWGYRARREKMGHDLSLTATQLNALRSAISSGLEVPPHVVEAAMRCVRELYVPSGCRPIDREEEQKKHPGQFMYSRWSRNGTTAMAAAGVVCFQEFGLRDDWRVKKSMRVVEEGVRDRARPGGRLPLDAFTIYYVSQALFEAGGKTCKESNAILREYLLRSQIRQAGHEADGAWRQPAVHILGKPGQLYMTSVGCIALAMPKRHLPILHNGRTAVRGPTPPRVVAPPEH